MDHRRNGWPPKPAGNLHGSCTEPVPALLHEAATKGITISVEGSTLRVRGPRSQEPLIRVLLSQKLAVLAVLSGTVVADAERVNIDVNTPPPTHSPQPVTQTLPDSDPCVALVAELNDLTSRVLPHWQTYITTRLEVDAASVERLAVCLEWVHKYAIVDGAPAPGSVLATRDKLDEPDAEVKGN